MKLLKSGFLALLTAVVLFSCNNDDDGASVQSAIEITSDNPISETNGVIDITITRLGGAGILEFTYEVAGSATAGEDFELPDSDTFSVPVNGEVVVSFPLINDEDVEGDETLVFNIIGVNSDASAGTTITIEDDDTFPYESGLLVTNEGPFNNGFGSVSFINGSLTTADNDIYQDVNNDNLGNIVQSIGFNGGDAYVVANVSNRITVVDRFTFEEKARIETGLENPRYFIAIDGTGYVSNWGDPFVATDDFIAIIDLETNTVTGTIPVSEGPERMLYNGMQLYVAQKGGFGVNNEITVIDPTTNTVETTITVGDVPESMRLADDGNLWVIGQGSPAFTGNETPGTISRIDTNTQVVTATFTFAVNEHPAYINIVEDDLYYYLNSAVYKGSVSNFMIPSIEEFTTPFLYNMSLSNNRTLVACDAGDFASNGNVLFYDLTTNTLINTLEVGVIPGNVYVN